MQHCLGYFPFFPHCDLHHWNVMLILNALSFPSCRTIATNMGSMRILIKGGKVVNDDFTQEADVYIENGIIQQVDYIKCTNCKKDF